jgi:hypothetical protein
MTYLQRHAFDEIFSLFFEFFLGLVLCFIRVARISQFIFIYLKWKISQIVFENFIKMTCPVYTKRRFIFKREPFYYYHF